ncbi:hypothetical protein F5I97DRAFT_1800216 [Phlebopus sp. FC_14]|nr:hypothetical protein F5I97DRAFT_1800216 [Phlebopus sp. FC_14]
MTLYETLGLSRHATPEEIRKAYRRKALETHPDRLPQGASAAERAASEEMFRKVNNAYEVLSDPANRKAYDQHGVWPPPTPQDNFHNYHRGRHHPFDYAARDPFSDPFFQDPFFNTRHAPFGHGFGAGPFSHHPFRGFTDPFVLFNSVFGDIHRAFASDPFFPEPFGHDLFMGPSRGGFFGGFMPPMSMFPPIGGPSNNNLLENGNMRGFSSSRAAPSGTGSRWVSESWTSSTVNGVTQSKCVRRDSDGNEHVIYKLPDGSERRTINGIEQAPSAVSAPGNDNRMLPPPYEEAVGTRAPPQSPATSHRRSGEMRQAERGGHGERANNRSSGSSWQFWRG